MIISPRGRNSVRVTVRTETTAKSGPISRFDLLDRLLLCDRWLCRIDGHRTRHGTVTRWECDFVWRTGRGFIYVAHSQWPRSVAHNLFTAENLHKKSENTFYKKVIIEL
jgi:hypothetical protein